MHCLRDAVDLLVVVGPAVVATGVVGVAVVLRTLLCVVVTRLVVVAAAVATNRYARLDSQ